MDPNVEEACFITVLSIKVRWSSGADEVQSAEPGRIVAWYRQRCKLSQQRRQKRDERGRKTRK